MTKEEYERLLKSDYWKGYSYSLIKERNFTCHDCGQSFPGERNKLQVHHLHYRDTNPWSYDPEELVVLCEKCHKKRHGILTPESPAHEAPKFNQQFETGGYNPFSESSFNPETWNPFDDREPQDSRLYEAIEEDRRWKKTIFYGFLMLVFVLFGIFIKQHKSSERAVEPVAFEVPIENETPVAPAKPKPSVVKKAAPTQAKREQMEMLERLDELVPTDLQGIEYKSHISEPSSGSDNVETAPVPTSEKTSLELLEEITHANTVKRAQEMGVSTEGSTLDIMERINHANTVKRAQEMGISTEGSTLDIMERINHANTVKRAQEMGVSTEGTTLEILERINRKHLENR